ncbi:MAG: hypothetical protein WC608_03185 [Parcubacteria group bacterium]
MTVVVGLYVYRNYNESIVVTYDEVKSWKPVRCGGLLTVKLEQRAAVYKWRSFTAFGIERRLHYEDQLIDKDGNTFSVVGVPVNPMIYENDGAVCSGYKNYVILSTEDGKLFSVLAETKGKYRLE